MAILCALETRCLFAWSKKYCNGKIELLGTFGSPLLNELVDLAVVKKYLYRRRSVKVDEVLDVSGNERFFLQRFGDVPPRNLDVAWRYTKTAVRESTPGTVQSYLSYRLVAKTLETLALQE